MFELSPGPRSAVGAPESTSSGSLTKNLQIESKKGSAWLDRRRVFYAICQFIRVKTTTF